MIMSNDNMDVNIIDEFKSMAIEDRTKEGFDDLLGTLEMVWNHKVYQDGLISSLRTYNREILDLSMTLARGLITQDEGSRDTLTKFKRAFENQQDQMLSIIVMNNTSIVFTKRQLRQLCLYYMRNGVIYFDKTMTVNDNDMNENYLFTFGEIVVNTLTNEDVVIVYEDAVHLHYVSMKMLQNEEQYILPRIVCKSDLVASPSGIQLVVTKEVVIDMVNEYAAIYATLN